MPDRGMCLLARVVADEALNAQRALAAYRLIDRRYADDPITRSELLQMLGFIPTQRTKRRPATTPAATR